MTIESIRTRIAERGYMGEERELLAMLDEAVKLLRYTETDTVYGPQEWQCDVDAFLSTSADDTWRKPAQPSARERGRESET